MAGNRWTRSSAASSRSVLAVLAVAGGVLLTGCGAGQQAQTAQQRPTVDGANVDVGPIAVRDMALEYPEGGVYEEGSDARLRLVVVNESGSSDSLVEVRTEVAEKVTILAAGEEVPGPTPTLTAAPSTTPSGTSLPTGTAENPSPSITGEPSGSASATAAPTTSAAPAVTRILIPSNGLVSFRDDGPTVLLTGLTEQLRAGQVFQVTLVFQSAGEVSATIAVGLPEEEISLAPTVEGGGEE